MTQPTTSPFGGPPEDRPTFTGNAPAPHGQSAYPPSGHPYPSNAHAYSAGPQHTPPQKTSGMAIAAFVVGIVSFLLAWIPVVNFVAIIGGLVALVLGILAINQARKGQVGGKGLAIAGVVLAALAVLIGILANVLFGVAINAVDDAVQQSLEDTENQLNDAGSEASEEEQAAAENAMLPLGQTAEVGEYTVTVTGVNLNANEIIANENQFNEPPTNQYVLVDISVVYNGDDEGDPWIDLSHSFQGTDARQYDSSSCTAVQPNPVMDVPTLTNGGAADYQVCMDVPAEAMDGASVFVEELLSFTDSSRAYWAVQ